MPAVVLLHAKRFSKHGDGKSLRDDADAKVDATSLDAFLRRDGDGKGELWVGWNVDLEIELSRERRGQRLSDIPEKLDVLGVAALHERDPFGPDAAPDHDQHGERGAAAPHAMRLDFFESSHPARPVLPTAILATARALTRKQQQVSEGRTHRSPPAG